MNIRAFVLEPVSQSVESATRFGKIRYLFKAGEKRSSIWSEDFKDEVLAALEWADFDPKSDYFVVTGHLVSLTLAMTTILQAYGSLRLLLYSITEREYVLRKV